MVAVDIPTGDTHTSSSSSSARSKESYTPYQDHYTHSSPQEPLLSTSAPSSAAAATSTTRGQHSDHHHYHHHHRRPSLSRSSSSFSSSYSSPTTKHNHQKQSTLTSGASLLTGCVYSSIGACYNRITAYLFPNEPEPLDLPSTLFFIAQVPFLFWVFLTWIPSFVVWFVGWRVSQAGDRGKGQGMRKTWSLRLALSLSFLKVYLRHADKLTIEECQSRSRSIPFMTAPAGIRIKKVKIPAFPFRNRAESIVYEHLTEEERGWLHWNRKGDETKVSSTTQEQMEEGEGLSVKVQREMEMELDSIQTAGSNHNDVRKKNNRKENNKKEDQFAEGLDAEWLEYVGPAETDADKAEMTSENMAAVLYFHGGGYYTGSKEEHRVLIGPLVRRLGKHVRILIINYRLAPQHPFPAALVDALSSYMWLMDQSVSETFGFDSPPATPSRPTDNFQPRQIVFMGDSAGGGLALSLSLLLRDHASPSIPQPAKIVTWSPWLDLTQALPSFKENALTDCIPYEDFTHLHSDAVDGMFRHMEAPEEAQHHQKGAGGVRQRAQVYCPDTCLRMKYVSPLYETDFRGIPEVLIVCGSAERFANECILLASRLEDQQLTCRIDIHEDMPHIFPLFRFHPSSMEALDRTSAYIRAAVSTSSSSSYTPFDGNVRNRRNRSDSVVIPISPSSSSCSVSSSGSNSPSPSPPPLTSRPMKELSRDGSSLVLMDDEAEGFFQHPRQCQQDVNGHGRVRRVGSSSSLSTADSSSTSVTQQQQQQGGQEQRHRRIRSAQEADFDPHSVQHSNNKKKKRTSVNVIDLSGSTVMSFHKQTRFGTPSDRDQALLELETQEEQAALLDDASGNGLGSSRRRRRRERLTLQDVVSDATLYEWEVLLKQGYVPTRLWPLPSSGGSLSRFSRQRRV